MKSKESGFSTAFALTVIFSLCVITLSFAMIVNANEKKICSYKKAFDARKNANAVEKPLSLLFINNPLPYKLLADIFSAVNLPFNFYSFRTALSVIDRRNALDFKSFIYTKII